MCNKELVLDTLELIEKSINMLLESTNAMDDLYELPKTADGMLRLNGICMSFIIIGEEFHRIDKLTDKKYLSEYSSINWSNVIGMRNILAHAYFEVDIDVVFNTLKNDIPPLLDVVKRMKISFKNQP
jgi:uncharacterized protein with HEPN domain